MENEQTTPLEQATASPIPEMPTPSPVSEETIQNPLPEKIIPNPVTELPPPSEFDGNTWQLLGWRLLGLLLTIMTLGIAYPWTQVMIYRWETKHTTINGKRLYFDGTGLQLLGMSLLWLLLTVITLGIFLIFLPVSQHKWRVKHTRFATPTDGNQVNVWAIVSAILACILGLVMIIGGINYLDQMPVSPLPNMPSLPVFTMPEGYTDFITPTQEATLPQGELYYVDNPSKGLNIRSGPSTDYDVVGNMPHGTPVYVFGWEGNWAKIEGGSGNYLDKEPPKAESSSNKNDSGDSKKDSGIVGSWLFMREKGDSVDVVVFQFKSDGTFRAQSSIVVKGFEEGEDWYWHGSSWSWDVIERPSWKGEYTYNGSELVLYYSTKTVTVNVKPSGNNLRLENPDVIRAHKDSVPMNEEGDPQPILLRLPKGADVNYNPAKITQSYFEG